MTESTHQQVQPARPTPKLSVVLPTFNGADYLEETINNIFGQEYPNLEFIIIDGGSTDATVDIIRRFEDRLAYWVSEPDRGQCHAINKGFAHATGDIHYWANADDLLEPGSFHHVAELLTDFSKPQWLVGGARLIDGRGRQFGERVPERVDDTTFLLWSLRWIPTQSVFWNRAMWEAAGPFDEHLHYVMDLGLWQRMHRAAPAIVTPRMLGWYRLHYTSKSLSSVEKSRAERKTHLASLIAADFADARNKGDEAVQAVASRYALLLDELADQCVMLEQMQRNRFLGPLLKAYRRYAPWAPELKA